MTKTNLVSFNVKDFLKNCLNAANLSTYCPLVDDAIFETFGVGGKHTLVSWPVTKPVRDHRDAWKDQGNGKPDAKLLKGEYFGIYLFFWQEGGFFLKIGQAGPNNDKRWGWAGKRLDGHYVLPINKAGALPGSTLAKFLWSQYEFQGNQLFRFDGDQKERGKLVSKIDSFWKTNKWKMTTPNWNMSKLKKLSGMTPERNELNDHYSQWIKENCERYNICFPVKYLPTIIDKYGKTIPNPAIMKEFADFFESVLQLYLQPLFEQNVHNP